MVAACNTQPSVTPSKGDVPLSDDALLDTLQRAHFNYMWEGAEPSSGLAYERIHMDGDYGYDDPTIITTGGSGFGIAGQDFSGYREYEVKNIKEGDVIIGGVLGRDFKIAEEKKTAKNAWVMKIGAISDEGVEVTTRESTITRTYGIPMALQGSQMCDGPCYDYMIIFSR